MFWTHFQEINLFIQTLCLFERYKKLKIWELLKSKNISPIKFTEWVNIVLLAKFEYTWMAVEEALDDHLRYNCSEMERNHPPLPVDYG